MSATYLSPRPTRLLTVAEAAAELGVSKWSVYRLVRNEELVPVPTRGRMLRFSPDAVAACRDTRAANATGLSVADVADAMQVGHHAVHALIKEGAFPGAGKVGPHFRIPAESYEAYLRGEAAAS